MKTSLPAVQSHARSRRWVRVSDRCYRHFKHHANRRYRRVLNHITRQFIDDPDSFDDETFDAPSGNSWDLC